MVLQRIMRRCFLWIFLGLVCSQAFAAQPWELPFRWVDGYLLVDARVAGHPESLTLLVDSGASVGVLSFAAAERLHLALGAVQPVQGLNADAVAHHLGRHPIIAQDAVLGEVQLAVDLARAAELCREPIDGLLGVDFFANRCVQIDFQARHFRFLTEKPLVGSSVTRVPLRWINEVLCAGVQVNGSSRRWARLDTGCNDALHWVVKASVPRSTPRDVTIGFITEERDLTVATLTMGKLTLPAVRTSLHPQPLFRGEAGLLGMGVLGQFRTTVDALRGELILER